MSHATPRPAHIASTPEEYFTPNPKAGTATPVNAVLCAMSRAQAVLKLVMDSGENEEDQFTASHTTVMSALWCVSGLLEQIETMIQVPYIKSNARNGKGE